MLLFFEASGSEGSLERAGPLAVAASEASGVGGRTGIQWLVMELVSMVDLGGGGAVGRGAEWKGGNGLLTDLCGGMMQVYVCGGGGEAGRVRCSCMYVVGEGHNASHA